MHRIDLNSLGVGRDEVKAALGRERRRGVRRRLVAVSTILAGKSIKQAGHAAKATRGSVERWLKQVRQSGLQSLLKENRRRHPKPQMDPDDVGPTRREIARALERPLKRQVHSRLVAIDLVLSGRLVDDAAAIADVRPNTVKRWLSIVIRDGIVATLARWDGSGLVRPRKLDADAAALRDLAAKERNPRIRKRILALACVADGMRPLDASIKAGLDHEAVLKRVRRFQVEGIAAFQDRKIDGRPPKLSPEQRGTLTEWIVAQPEIDEDGLCAQVKAQFGVSYSPSHMRRLACAARTPPSSMGNR